MSEPLCPVCGGVVPPKRTHGPRAIYCSVTCRRSAAKRSARKPYVSVLTVKRCDPCGKEFRARSDAVSCSPVCGQARRDGGRLPCSMPGCEKGVRAKGLCAMHWKRAARAEGRIPNEPWDDRRRANWKKRYALTRGAPEAESFDYREVYKRDGWRCGICGEHVDPNLAWPDPLSASLDHVLPVSLGGVHSPANAQCSHLVCNVRKGAAA